MAKLKYDLDNFYEEFKKYKREAVRDYLGKKRNMLYRIEARERSKKERRQFKQLTKLMGDYVSNKFKEFLRESQEREEQREMLEWKEYRDKIHLEVEQANLSNKIVKKFIELYGEDVFYEYKRTAIIPDHVSKEHAKIFLSVFNSTVDFDMNEEELENLKVFIDDLKIKVEEL